MSRQIRHRRARSPGRLFGRRALTGLDAQFAFLNEADRLKSVTRANCLLDGSRDENSAEHSWHVALWALVFADHADTGTDISRAI